MAVRDRLRRHVAALSSAQWTTEEGGEFQQITTVSEEARSAPATEETRWRRQVEGEVGPGDGEAGIPGKIHRRKRKASQERKEDDRADGVEQEVRDRGRGQLAACRDSPSEPSRLSPRWPQSRWEWRPRRHYALLREQNGDTRGDTARLDQCRKDETGKHTQPRGLSECDPGLNRLVLQRLELGRNEVQGEEDQAE